MNARLIVTCVCGQQNRLPAVVPEGIGKVIRCGRCKFDLGYLAKHAYEDASPDVDPELDALFREGGQL